MTGSNSKIPTKVKHVVQRGEVCEATAPQWMIYLQCSLFKGWEHAAKKTVSHTSKVANVAVTDLSFCIEIFQEDDDKSTDLFFVCT